MEADGLADAPLDTVAHHGLAERARHGETDARTAGCGSRTQNAAKRGPGEAGTFVINSSEIFRSQQTDTFRKTWDGKSTSRS